MNASTSRVSVLLVPAEFVRQDRRDAPHESWPRRSPRIASERAAQQQVAEARRRIRDGRGRRSRRVVTGQSASSGRSSCASRQKASTSSRAFHRGRRGARREGRDAMASDESSPARRGIRETAPPPIGSASVTRPPRWPSSASTASAVCSANARNVVHLPPTMQNCGTGAVEPVNEMAARDAPCEFVVAARQRPDAAVAEDDVFRPHGDAGKNTAQGLECVRTSAVADPVRAAQHSR